MTNIFIHGEIESVIGTFNGYSNECTRAGPFILWNSIGDLTSNRIKNVLYWLTYLDVELWDAEAFLQIALVKFGKAIKSLYMSSHQISWKNFWKNWFLVIACEHVWVLNFETQKASSNFERVVESHFMSSPLRVWNKLWKNIIRKTDSSLNEKVWFTRESNANEKSWFTRKRNVRHFTMIIVYECFQRVLEK